MNATSELRRVDTPGAVQAAADRLAEVRDHVGPDIDTGVDFHGRVSKPMAKQLARALESYEPMFIEEPLLPEHSDELADLSVRTTIPIATGERLYSPWDFKHLFEDGSVDVIQPDLSHAGGITEVSKFAAMTEAYYVALVPHCSLGPIALAASIQIDATSPDALI